MDKDTFRKYGHEIVDWIADYFENVRHYPVRSEAGPGDIISKLPKEPPAGPEEMKTILKDFKEIILPGMTHWQHPGWFAYFPANNSPASVLGEMLTAGLGAQCMSWETSPAATELEEVVTDWLRQMTGLPEGMKGVIHDTASTATLTALLTAREVATGFTCNETGLYGFPGSREEQEAGTGKATRTGTGNRSGEKTAAGPALRVYASAEAHSSIEKGVRMAGYGRKNLIYIEIDENYAMRPDKLEEAIQEDIERGFRPACVIATVGTTSSTAIDPVDEIGAVCKKHGIWLHVDAAMAGTAAILEEKRDLMKGAEYVDSLVFNPHKWMMTNFDCSAYFVRNPEHLIKTMSINPEYLKTGRDAQVNNYRDWGIQLGRRFRALKLWFVIRHYGVDGLKEIVRNHIRMAQWLGEQVRVSNHFELLAPISASLVCFRRNDGNSSEKELDRINRELLMRINETGEVFLTHTLLSGRYTIRLSVGQRTTTLADVERAWEIINQAAGGNR
ncbi:MAG: aminotransferase class V-fold PLP-dependent enzyme [Marinilabiliales bacterium]|nr:MAG: aminotransferase class V-fold PLP-dependent enzyme [Marinilabiliales bacterium]